MVVDRDKDKTKSGNAECMTSKDYVISGCGYVQMSPTLLVVGPLKKYRTLAQMRLGDYVQECMHEPYRQTDRHHSANRFVKQNQSQPCAKYFH